MRKLYRVLPLALAAFVAFTPMATSTYAQSGGGIILDSTFGAAPDTFNPIFCDNTACARVQGFMYPSLTGVDPKTGQWMKKAPGALAADWTISDDLKTYTFKLRTDWKWSDGTQITSKDVLYGWTAVSNPDTKSRYISLTDSIADVKAPDPQTVVINFKEGTCTALGDAATIPVVPSHVLGDDFKNLKSAPYNTNPQVTAGVFKFGEYRPGERTTLVANPDYPDAIDHKVVPQGYIQKVVGDQAVQVEQFLAGQTNVLDNVPPARKADVRAAGKKGDVQIYDFPGNAWDYIGFNLADPKNPQSGLDKDGKPIDQGHHPIFGDAQVRKAIAMAIDVDAIIKGAVFGEGSRIVSASVPSSWAYPADIKPIAYDPKAAAKLLDAAGWVAGSDGKRVAKGAKYAKDGTPFKFTLLTNEGNTRRAAIATIVKDELGQLGIEVDFKTMESNAFFDELNKQTSDAFIAGWRNGFPDDPDSLTRGVFGAASDVPGSGDNYTSFYDTEYEKITKQAQTLPGCDQAARAKLYHRAHEILSDQLPYIFLFVQNGMYVARSNVKGFGPYPNQMYWNVETWNVVNAQ